MLRLTTAVRQTASAAHRPPALYDIARESTAAQVFPYFYVPYDDDLPADPAAAHSYLRDLAQGIEIAMRSSYQVSTHGCHFTAVAYLVLCSMRHADDHGRAG